MIEGFFFLIICLELTRKGFAVEHINRNSMELDWHMNIDKNWVFNHCQTRKVCQFHKCKSNLMDLTVYW